MSIFIFHKIFQDSIYRSCLYFACVVHVCSQGEIRCKAPAEGDPVLATCPEENVNPEQDDMHRLVGCIPKILGSSLVRAPVSALIIIYTYMYGWDQNTINGLYLFNRVYSCLNAYLRFEEEWSKQLIQMGLCFHGLKAPECSETEWMSPV